MTGSRSAGLRYAGSGPARAGRTSTKRCTTSRWLLSATAALLLLSSATLRGEETAEAALDEGYSMLHADVSMLRRVDLLLLVKFESTETERIVDHVSDYLTRLQQQLERLAAEEGIRLDLDPLPAIERRTRAMATRARLASFAPLVGRTGADFERTLLLSLSGALNQLLHLAEVMADAERSEARAGFLKSARDRLGQLRESVERRLNEAFFVHDAYTRR